MLLSRAYLEPRGWKSVDMLTKAKGELLKGGFIFQTVMGHRPNKASWYAVTWRALDKLAGYDDGASELFRQGAYKDGTALTPKPTRDELFARWRNAGAEGKKPKPPHGTETAHIAPPHGTETPPPVPPHGAISPCFEAYPVPPHGHHLEMPSVGLGYPVH